MKTREVKYEVYWKRSNKRKWVLDYRATGIRAARKYVKDAKAASLYPDEHRFRIMRVHIEREFVE